MHTLARGFAVVCALAVLGVGSPALAAPDRLNDDVPSAFPDNPGAWAFSYNREMIDLEGALTTSSTAHDYFKLRYTLSPKVAASVRYTVDDLNGGLALVNPVFNNQDSGNSFEVDLRTNLLNVPQTPADADKQQEFAAGSAFSLGVSGTFYQLDAGNLGRDENLIKAYLLYTTDLTEEMTAHTYFSSGRLAGDESSGSVNRIGAGIDYVLMPGDHPLTLMANGILDIYNFREPSFNTSRVSRFDLGLRYQVSHDWFASLGWVTVNDSENDASGSGIFAGLNYVQMPRPVVECPPAEETPAEAAPPEEDQSASVADGQALAALPPAGESNSSPVAVQSDQQAAGAPETPPLMAGVSYTGSVNRFDEPVPESATGKTAASTEIPPTEPEHEASLAETASLREASANTTGFEPLEVSGGPYYFDPERAEQNEQAAGELDVQPSTANTETEASLVLEPLQSTEPSGIDIPGFPNAPPQHTPLHAVMIRAGVALPMEVPRTTAPGQQMTRAPRLGENAPTSVTEAAEDVDVALEKAISSDTYADTGASTTKA